jgi:hypothetical protein
MPKLSFKTSFDASTKLVISPSELRNIYLFGINILEDQRKSLSDEDISMFIEAAQTEVENQLQLKLVKQKFTENLSFSNSDWVEWGFIKASHQIVCPLSAIGYLNTVKQVTYPKEWLVVKKSSDEREIQRNLYLVPVGGNVSSSQNAVYSGIIPQVGYLNQRSIPYYWEIQYVTGFETIPADLINIIGKLAAVNLFHLAGDLVLGLPGINSKSIGIDGLSQSLSSSKGFNDRIQAYIKEITDKWPALIGFYKGISFGVA